MSGQILLAMIVQTSVHTFITAPKQSLRQGNFFTRICHSVHGGGGEVHATHTPCSVCPLQCMPLCHACPLPCMHPSHACPPAMHALLPHTPLLCMPPFHAHAHHAPCNACPLPCMPPCHVHPLPCMPPCHVHPLPCMPPTPAPTYVCPPCTPPHMIRSMSRRYAFYWNASLFTMLLFSLTPLTMLDTIKLIGFSGCHYDVSASI